MDKACGLRKGEKKCIQGFVWKHEERRFLGRSRCGREDNITMGLKQVE
jgi:hypothetical protein